MKYGHIISSAFTTLKSGALWGFAVSVYGAITMLYVLLVGGAVALTGPARLASGFRGIDALSGGAWVSLFAPLFGATLLAIILTIPLSLLMHGGLIHLADEILAGRRVGVGQGWAFGAKRMGRTFAIDFVVGFVSFLAMGVAMVPFVVGVVGVAAGSDSGTPSAGAFVGICCGYLLFLLVAVALSLLTAGFEAIAIRYGLVGTRTADSALGAGWQAFRARWKNVVVFSLIALGLQWVFSTVTSMITVPLQFFVVPPEFTVGTSTPSAEQLPGLLIGSVVLIAVSVVLTIPWTVFNYSLWGAFFRQLTGLDVVTPPAPPAPDTDQPSADV